MYKFGSWGVDNKVTSSVGASSCEEEEEKSVIRSILDDDLEDRRRVSSSGGTVIFTANFRPPKGYTCASDLLGVISVLVTNVSFFQLPP